MVKCTLTGPTNITQACTNGGMPTSPFGPVLARLASTFRPFCGAGIIIFHDTLFQKSDFCQTLLFYSFLKMWRWMVRCEDRRAQVLRKHLQKGWIQDIANQYWNGPNSFPGKNGECCNSKCPVLQSNALFPQKKRRSPFPTFFLLSKDLVQFRKKERFDSSEAQSTTLHSVWKSPKNVSFLFLDFPTSGNTVWPQASGFQKLTKLTIFGHF